MQGLAGSGDLDVDGLIPELLELLRGGLAAAGI